MRLYDLDALAGRTPHTRGHAVPAKPAVSAPAVPLCELMTPEFIAECSRFADVREMLAASGFRIESTKDFDAVPADLWNDFIRRESRYPSWNAMTRAARGEWMWRRMGL